jgi:hypothetical protein
MLLKASSPYARRGVLYDDYRRYYGRDDADVLVWKASSRQMNPSIPESFVAGEYEKDAANAAAEYGGEFRSDIDSFVSREAVEQCVVQGRYELPPLPHIQHVAFVDPSGGSADSMTLAVAHREGTRAVLDVVREVRPPFSPESVVSEFASVLKTYRIRSVVGDRYAGLWPRERFAVHGITYEASAKPKTDIYRDLLPAVNGGRLELLDHPKLIAQLCALERRTARGGRDSIDHPPGQHDDLINCAAGALTALIADPKMNFAPPIVVGRADVPPHPTPDAPRGSIVAVGTTPCSFEEWMSRPYRP